MSTTKPAARESGDNEKNIYIPSFIAARPFYAGDSESDYLEHQRLKAEPKDTLDRAKWYERGRRIGPAATKYRKGACENCGAMTHKTKECLYRPRKQGAKWTGKDIQADERLEDVNLGWDAKRDRWNGYDAGEYDAVVQEYKELENLRQSAAKSKNRGAQGERDEQAENSDPAKYMEEADMGRSRPASARQLRLREDTAKYLLNLDPDSAKYDPKTRSMDVEASSLRSTETGEFEGFARPAALSGDAEVFERAQQYVWETQESLYQDLNAKKIHLQANPTEGEFLLKKKATENAERKATHRKALFDKYGDGGAAARDQKSSSPSIAISETPFKAIISSSTYIEYDKYGAPKPPQGRLKSKPLSKYAEGILINNHTSVWGSFWLDFKWGYACCHSLIKNSYCTGDAGRVAFKETEGLRKGEGLMLEDHSHEAKMISGGATERLKIEQIGTDIQELEEKEVDTSTAKEHEVSGKRAFEQMQGVITEEELKAYKRYKLAANEPTSRFDNLIDRA